MQPNYDGQDAGLFYSGTKMKPCPFCRSTEVNYYYPDEHGAHVCWCGNCGAFGPNDVSESKAREMWNLRRPMDELANSLLALTPGGSEFYGSPQRCLSWIKDRMSMIGKIAAERNELREQVADLLAACNLALQYTKDYMPNLTDDDGWKQHQALVDAIDTATVKAAGEKTVAVSTHRPYPE